MAYSTDADLERVFPKASGTATANDSDAVYTVTYSGYRNDSNREIDNRLHGLTAVPVDTSSSTTVSGSLAEVEALLTAGRMLRANARYNANQTVLEQAKLYEEEANEVLEGMYFPASASTPVQAPQFQGTGTSISVTVADDFTYKGTWSLRCITAGGSSTAAFELAVLDRHRSYGPWIVELSDGTAWPTQDDMEQATKFSSVKDVSLVVSGEAFEVGDTWTWISYPRTRLKRKQSVGFLPWRRRF